MATTPGPCTMRMLALYTVGKMAPGTPRVMHRSHALKSDGLVKVLPPNVPRAPASARFCPSAVVGGSRPFGGSITSELRLDGESAPRSSQCGGGDVAEPTWPALEVSAVSTLNSALSVSSCR